jgi:hypothetical protein
MPEVGHPMVPLIWLLGQPHLRWEWWAIISSSPVVRIVFYHVMEVSCYHFFFERLNCNSVCALLLWGLLFASTSRHSVEVRSMLNSSALTCSSASQSCLRIHLGCLTALLEQSIWSLRLPQEMQRRSSRWAHTSFGIPLAPDNLIVWENLLFPLLALVEDQAPRKDYGTDCGCARIQSNGIIALEIKCYCRRFVNSCGTVLIFGSW